MCPRRVCLGIPVSPSHHSFAHRLDVVLRCHLGKTILYDTVSNLSWSVDIRTHTIVTVIEKVLSEPWAPSVEIGREVPEALAEEDCVVCIVFSLVYSGQSTNWFEQECYSWEYGDFPQ